MRTVIQRVSHASVTIPDHDYRSEIGKGLLVLAAFTDDDDESDLEWTARKIAAMRIMPLSSMPPIASSAAFRP